MSYKSSENRIVVIVTAIFALIYLVVIISWNIYVPEYNLAIQSPGADNRPEGSSRTINDVLIGEFFMRYNDESSLLQGKWSCFRGADFSNIIRTPEAINVMGDYPVEWSFTTGEGHAAPVIFNGMVFILDYDESLSSDALRCFSLESGKELWRRWYRVPMKRNHGFSRTAPVVSQQYVITVGPQGHVMCCDPFSGNLKWSIDMQKQFKTEIPFWYTGQCPRIDDNTLVLAPAGDETLLMGINCDSGEIIWQTPNSIGYKMSHSSISPMTLGGKKTYVYAGVGGVCGISAEKNDLGTLLWHVEKWQPSVVAPSPMQLSQNDIFVVAGYGSGGALLQVNNPSGKWNASVKEQYKPSEGMSSEQQTPILYNNLIMSIMPKDGGAMRGRLVLHTPSDLHKPVWSSEERFGLGPYLAINNNLFVFNDDGELYVYEIQPKSMKLLKKQHIIEEGVDAWGPMAYADGRLIVRDAHNVYCLKIN
jgi:outer membrane protein assembly factor BamB